MHSDFPTPGLKRRKRKSGPDVLYWVRPRRPREGRLRARDGAPALPPRRSRPTSPSLSAACLKFQAEMLEWSSGRTRDLARFDGTIAGLSRKYQVDEASPFQRRKHTTRRKDLHVLKIIEKAFGKRALAALQDRRLRRWYDAAKKPKEPGGRERVRRAHGIIKKLRELFAYGVMAELPECKRLVEVLRHARFAQPARRGQRLELHHVEAFIAEGHRDGPPLAGARHRPPVRDRAAPEGRDRRVGADPGRRGGVGHRAPRPAMGERAHLVRPRQRPRVTKRTTKTGAYVAHDLKLCPIVLGLLDQVPAERRVGPLIIDEAAGRPYADTAYGREWRVVARAAGIPDTSGTWTRAPAGSRKRRTRAPT